MFAYANFIHIIIHKSVYICAVKDFLDNPVYYALLSGDAHKALGTDQVKYFDKEISPFVGFHTGYENGFKDLYELLPVGRNILYASRNEIPEPNGWELIHHIPGTQFLYLSKKEFDNDFSEVTPLDKQHVDQMVDLARLTKPGPFDKRTIEFGNYHGIINNDKLVAMTGRRLHIHDFIEISAVCTHPDFLGRGYAGNLLAHQINSILNENKTPFLHVRSDNTRAIDIYERLGFVQNEEMHFYFLRRME
jgi:ribosomal protein S18 acetylase RimI-like enzyme